MGNPVQNTRRFRINPVEAAIFSVVALVFLHSVYNLFYDGQGFHPSTVVTLTPAEWVPQAAGRSIASSGAATPLFLNYDLQCDRNADQTTTAGKVRLTGSLCGAPAPASESRNPSSASKLLQVEVTNSANKFTATVFTDAEAGKFSTDYIPLNTGRNPIQVEFTYPNGRKTSQSFSIEKN